MDVRILLCSSLSCPEGPVLILAISGILLGSGGHLPDEDLESEAHVPFPTHIHSSFSHLSGSGGQVLIPALKSYQLKVKWI